MATQDFFKPTILYKEYMILDLVEKNKDITQREISKTIGIAVSMVNDHLDTYVKQGFIKRKKHTTKTVEYLITKKGSERRKVLNMGYLNSTQQLYNSAKENIEQFLMQINDKGFKNVLLYGAGEVCEIMLSTIKGSKSIRLNVKAIIDDNAEKQHHLINEIEITGRDSIKNIEHDGILISSFTNNETIYNKLKDLGYDEHKIIQFFSIQ